MPGGKHEYIRQVDLLCAARGLVVRAVPADVAGLSRRTFADLWALYERASSAASRKKVGEALVVRDMLRRELRTGMCDVLGQVDAGNNFVYESLRGAMGYSAEGCKLTPSLKNRGRESLTREDHFDAEMAAHRRQSYAAIVKGSSAGDLFTKLNGKVHSSKTLKEFTLDDKNNGIIIYGNSSSTP